MKNLLLVLVIFIFLLGFNSSLVNSLSPKVGQIRLTASDQVKSNVKNETEKNSNGRKIVRKGKRIGDRFLHQNLRTPQDMVSDIHCMHTPTISRFSALLRPPKEFQMRPVLEMMPSTSTLTFDASKSQTNAPICSLSEANLDGTFVLELGKIEECGVRPCIEQGETWLCVMIRFPMLAGLRLPEDEVIDIKCKPQDRSIQGQNFVNFQENLVEQKSPAVFLGGGQNFLSEIGLFRQLPGTALFAERVQSGSTIELGENVQLRSIVRDGDGWNFAKITDVLVHRVRDGVALTASQDIANLVDSDGCTNPMYGLLAPSSPWRDSENPLINNFDFRVFMFEQMINGETIMITAKVIACVEEIDCAPVRCSDIPGAENGFGRRRRRRSLTNSVGKTTDWEENLELKIRMPSLISNTNKNKNVAKDEAFKEKEHKNKLLKMSEMECKVYLIVTLSVALTFCVLSATIVIVACLKRCQEVNRHRRAKIEASSTINVNKDAANLTGSSTDGGEGALQKPTVTYYPYFIQTYDQSNVAPAFCPSKENPAVCGNGVCSLPAVLNGGSRPVTVRSVKRRDKAKTEEKAARLMEGNNTDHNNGLPDERAVMV